MGCGSTIEAREDHVAPQAAPQAAHQLPPTDTPLGRKMYEPMLAVHSAAVLKMDRLHSHEDLKGNVLKEWHSGDGPLIFISHQWTSYTQPDASGEQLALIQTALRKQLNGTATDESVGQREMRYLDHWHDTVCGGAWIWLDYWSIPQLDSKAKMRAIQSIPAYLEYSDAMATIAPPITHAETEQQCDYASYSRRGWCRLERLGFFMKAYSAGELQPLYVFNQHTGLPDIMEAFRSPYLSEETSVFHGDFSCCRLGHMLDGQPLECDKLKLVPIVDAMHTRQCVELQTSGDLSGWRRLVAKRWIYLAGVDIDAVSSMVEPSTVKELCVRYAFQDLHEVTDKGMSLAHYAAYENSRVSIALLAEAKADLNVGDRAPLDVNVPGGCAPLLCASLGGCSRAVAALLDYKADVNLANEAGATALHAAVFWGNNTADLTKLLLDKGADPAKRADRFEWAKDGDVGLDTKTWMHKDALHLASTRGSPEIVQALLDFGVSTSQVAGPGQHEGMTALQIAEVEGNTDVVELIRAHAK